MQLYPTLCLCSCGFLSMSTVKLRNSTPPKFPSHQQHQSTISLFSSTASFIIPLKQPDNKFWRWQIHVPSRLLTHWLQTIITRNVSKAETAAATVGRGPSRLHPWFQCASLPWCDAVISCRDPGTPGSNVPAPATSNMQQSCWIEDVSMMRWNV